MGEPPRHLQPLRLPIKCCGAIIGPASLKHHLEIEARDGTPPDVIARARHDYLKRAHEEGLEILRIRTRLKRGVGPAPYLTDGSAPRQ